jgi:Calx-beta domain/FG-GAP-like repeat
MWLQNVFQSLTSTSSRQRPPRRRSRGSRLRIESFEDRCLPSFGLAANYYVGSGQISIDVGDFNGDGHADVASAGETGVAVLLNNGDGSLADGVIYSLDARTITAAVGEVNGDGKLDLVATTWEWHTIYVPDEEGNWYPVDVNTGDVRVLLGDGTGSFTATATYDLGDGRYFDSVLIDLDRDGDLDLATSNMDGHDSSVLLGNGDGTFAPPQKVAVGFETHQLDLADLNGDGNLDWLAGNFIGNDVRVLRGNGNGSFQPAQTVATLTAIEGYANPSGQAVGDFNGDDMLDLAITYTGTYGDQETVYQDGYVQVFVGNGDGTFAPRDSVPIGPGWIKPVEVADFDGDGNLDMVVGGPFGVRLLRGSGDGTFDSSEPPPVGMGGVPYDIVVADLDGNGEPDIATANQGSNITVLLNGDGPPPELSINDVTITEGNAGTRAANFTVTLSAASEQPVTVAYDTSDGYASAGADYQAASGTLTIPAGQTTATITVVIKGDRLGEWDEGFDVVLSSPTNAIFADRQAVGTIVDDEPRISISDVTRTEGKKGQTTLFTFTVTLSAAYDQPVTMSFGTVNDTATTGNNDYVAKTGTLTFAPGQTTKTITIEVKGDSKREGNERFFLDLYGLSSNGQFAKSLGIGLILNDD